MSRPRLIWTAGLAVCTGVALLVAALLVVLFAFRIDPGRAAGTTPPHWISTWATAAQPAVPGTKAADGLNDQTLRQNLYASIGGDELRVELSNLYGTRPLTIGAASVGVARGTPQQLLFSGAPSITIPPGAVAMTDPLRTSVAPLAELTVSLFLPGATGPLTENADAQQVAFVGSGNRVTQAGAGGLRHYTHSSLLIAGVDVDAPAADPGAIVALGDSITDGVGSALNADNSWPEDLAHRLHASGDGIAVLNAGIGGNRVLNTAPCCGENAVARFQQDVADHPGVRAVILLEGVNDIGFSDHHDALTAPHTDVSAAQIIAGDEQIIALAHADGLKILGGTITPFQGAQYWTAAGEVKREAINNWILHSNRFDGVIDFATVLADPSDPMKLNPIYDHGDHLHPNASGYLRMANAVDLAMLQGAVS